MYTSPKLTTSTSIAGAVLYLSFATNVAAHEHHSDDIPEGEVVSVDPIVRYFNQIKSYVAYLTLGIGCNIMDSHRHSNSCFRHHFPDWHGPGRMSTSLFKDVLPTYCYLTTANRSSALDGTSLYKLLVPSSP